MGIERPLHAQKMFFQEVHVSCPRADMCSAANGSMICCVVKAERSVLRIKVSWFLMDIFVPLSM